MTHRLLTRQNLLPCARRSGNFIAALLQQVTKQFLPQLLLAALELQRTLLLHLHPVKFLLLLASTGLQTLQTRQLLFFPRLLQPRLLLPLCSLLLLLFLLQDLKANKLQNQKPQLKRVMLLGVTATAADGCYSKGPSHILYCFTRV